MIARLLSVGPKGWWLLAEAQAAVLRAHVLVRLHPVGELVAGGAPAVPEGATAPSCATPQSVDAPMLAAARSLEQAVSRVSRLGLTRPLCLARSLALLHLLERRNITGAAVCVGVRMVDGGLSAHAWVEWRGVTLGDSEESVRRYTRIRDLTVLARGVAFPGRRAA